MIFKETVVERIEINADGSINILLVFCLKEDEDILQRENHRFVLSPGEDIPSTFGTVNSQITGMKKAAVSSEEISRVQSVADLVWTAEVVGAYKAMVRDNEIKSK